MMAARWLIGLCAMLRFRRRERGLDRGYLLHAATADLKGIWDPFYGHGRFQKWGFGNFQLKKIFEYTFSAKKKCPVGEIYWAFIAMMGYNGRIYSTSTVEKSFLISLA